MSVTRYHSRGRGPRSPGRQQINLGSRSFLCRGGEDGGRGGGGGWGGGEGGVASWGGGAVDAGYVDAFLAAALTHVMRAAVPIPAVAVASVLHSAAVGGSVVGVVGFL